MEYRLKAYSILEFGQRKDAQGRPHQEDSIYPAAGELRDSDRTFILCDGMGGHDAGEVASATVCEAMAQSVLNDGHDAEGVFTDDDLRNAIADAYDALDARDSGAARKMGTTMTFLKLHNTGATVAHIGDSRVYHIRPGQDGESTRILFETEDHSLVNDLVKIGELTREEAHMSPQKNVITRAMQPNMGSRCKADIHHITDIQPGDYFYMCSDGMLEEPDMEDGVSLRNIFSARGGSDEQKVEILRNVTEDNRDNHTALIIHILDVTGSTPVADAATLTPGADIPPRRMAIVEEDTAQAANSVIPPVPPAAPTPVPPAAPAPNAQPAPMPDAKPGNAPAPRNNRKPRKGRRASVWFLIIALVAVLALLGLYCIYFVIPDRGKDTGGETPAVTIPKTENSAKTEDKKNRPEPQSASGKESEKLEKEETREQPVAGASTVSAIRGEAERQQAATVANGVLKNDTAPKREDELTPAKPKPDPDNKPEQPDEPKKPEGKPV